MESYENRLVSMWIDNNEGYYSRVQAMTRANMQSPDDLAAALKAMVEEEIPAGFTDTLAGQLFTSAFEDVDWNELAEQYYLVEMSEIEDDSEAETGEDIGDDDEQDLSGV